MNVKSHKPVNRNKKLLTGEQFHMLGGVTAEEDELLQAQANAAVARIFKRRVRRPAKLLADFHDALRHCGFTGIEAKVLCPGIWFTAKVGEKLKKRLRPGKYIKQEDLVYGVVTGAARRAGLDPRIEDIGVHRDGDRVEGFAHVVPFIHQTEAVDRVIARSQESPGGLATQTRDRS